MTCFPAQSKTAFKQCKEENQVLIASNVQIYTSGHPVLPQERLVAGNNLLPDICQTGYD